MSDQAARALGTDPALEPVVEEYGPLALDPAPDLFRRLVVSTVRQQVSMDAATAIRERLFDGFEVTPEAMLAAESEALNAVGLSSAKVDYVKAVSRAFRTRGYTGRRKP